MGTIVYSCPFVPAEWIAAHGLRPSRILPGSAGGSPFASEGVCPYASAFAHAACAETAADAIVFTTLCDQMRRMSERAVSDDGPPVFLMNVPSTWQTATAERMYMSEVKRLGRFLVRLGGKEPSPSELATVMREHEAKRAALRDARGRVSPRDYSAAIARFHRDGVVDIGPPASDRSARAVPLGLVAGPLLLHHFQIFDLIESYGGHVVLDATTSGERTMPARFDPRKLDDDPLAALADAYFGSIPDASRRPNDQLYAWLAREVSDRGIRGLVFRFHTWCDLWHAEAQRMKDWSPVPLLAIAMGADDHVDAHTASRIEAFLEMLR